MGRQSSLALSPLIVEAAVEGLPVIAHHCFTALSVALIGLMMGSTSEKEKSGCQLGCRNLPVIRTKMNVGS